MLFNSLTFLLFFALVLAGYYLLRNWSARKGWLLLASYVFYAAWSPPFVLLLAGSSLADWWLARRLQGSVSERARRTWLVFSLVSNLGLLGYFKYGGFLLENFIELAAAFGVQYSPPVSNIILPVGISFYTFQSLSYTIDVYRRHLRADWSLPDFLLYVSFFPQLVAGPIVRAAHFLPQLRAPKRASRDAFHWGLCLLVIGLFCKIVMADSVFAPAVDPVYADPAAATMLDAWTAVFAFSGQIYYDFCGYSICAVGAALCLGFHLPENFNRPYAAIGFSDFWRRWHLSLSTWLRDYLYIPLGGSHHGSARTATALMLTMLLGGLWHGASWLFVIWGGLHGGLLALERAARGSRVAKTLAAQPLFAPMAALATFMTVTLIWIPFRAASADEAVVMISRLVKPADTAALLDPMLVAVAFAGSAITLAWQWRQRGRRLSDWFAGLATDTQAVVIAMGTLLCYLCAGDDQHAFIYFQF